MHELYRESIEKAVWSHENHRSVFHIKEEDVITARLYAYAYRAQTIGAFHGCREALRGTPGVAAPDYHHGQEALRLLQELQDLGTLEVPEDFRALIFMLYYYDHKVKQVVAQLKGLAHETESEEIERIKAHFERNLSRITESNGIFVARDDVLPDQGSFIVPNLGITIVPLIYGDHHSWNSSHLPGRCIGVTNHRHHQGIEIHLGYSPMHGITMLDGYRTEIREGYAMPIPVMSDHGLDNLSEDEHWVPFIFGSKTLSGWGVFFDVEPRPVNAADLREVPLESNEMRNSVYIERAIEEKATAAGTEREIVIPASATASGKVGALELGIARVDDSGFTLTGDTYKILSVVRGKGSIEIGGRRQTLNEHDHVGIPAKVDSSIDRQGEEALVILDAVILDDTT